jgi:hypothetical protein
MSCPLRAPERQAPLQGMTPACRVLIPGSSRGAPASTRASPTRCDTWGLRYVAPVLSPGPTPAFDSLRPHTMPARGANACGLSAAGSVPISSPGSSPSLAQALARIAARAEDARMRRKRLATEDQRHRMVGREPPGSDWVRLAMPARTAPAVVCDPVLDRPLREPSPGGRASHRMVRGAAEAVGEARTATPDAAPLVRRGPAAGAGVLLAAPTRADP